jgi:hypothetical protein
LYCDTDSLFIGVKMDNILLKSSMWSRIDEAIFISSKIYATRSNKIDNIKIKGVRGKHLSFNEVVDLFYWGGKRKIPTTIFKKGRIKITIDNIEKEITFDNYKKREFNSDKTDTKPIYIEKSTLKDERYP